MSIIVPSSHTRIGAWRVNIKTQGRNPLFSMLYNTVNCHVMQGHKKKKGDLVHHQTYRNGKTIPFYTTPIGNFTVYNIVQYVFHSTCLILTAQDESYISSGDYV